MTSPMSSPMSSPPTSCADPRTIPALVERAARDHGDHEAVVDGAHRLTFGDLRTAAREVARALIAAGVRRGDRVALWAPNSHRWIAAALGTAEAGAVLVPVNTRYKGAEARDIVRRSGAVLLLTDDTFLGNGYLDMLRGEAPADAGWAAAGLPALRHAVTLDPDGTRRPHATPWTEFLAAGEAVSPGLAEERRRSVGADDTADILFTSGTTGTPKGAMCTHGQNVRTYQAWSDRTGLRQDDRYLVVNPMFHCFGYKAGVLACLLKGTTMVLQPVFEAAQTLRLVETERITVLPGPPTVYTTLLDSPERSRHDLTSLRLAVTGSADVPVSLVRRVRTELFPEVLTAYGLTESCGTVSVCTLGDDDETVASTSGRPVDGVEVRIAAPDGTPAAAGEDGEILVRGHTVMRGYLDDPDATARALHGGWLHTGDVGRLDPSGNLVLTGRSKDMFTVGGFNVYPAEVEQVLARHPAVSTCVVVPVPDARLGEVGHAHVVPRPGASPDPGQLLAHCREHLANFKAPRGVTLTPDLPRNASGKPDRALLRAQALKVR